MKSCVYNINRKKFLLTQWKKYVVIWILCVFVAFIPGILNKTLNIKSVIGIGCFFLCVVLLLLIKNIRRLKYSEIKVFDENIVYKIVTKAGIDITEIIWEEEYYIISKIEQYNVTKKGMEIYGKIEYRTRNICKDKEYILLPIYFENFQKLKEQVEEKMEVYDE